MTDDLKILALAPIAAAQRSTTDTPRGAGFGAALDQAMETPREPDTSPAVEHATGPRGRADASRKAPVRAQTPARANGKESAPAAGVGQEPESTAQGQVRLEVDRDTSSSDGSARRAVRKAAATQDSVDVVLNADAGSIAPGKPVALSSSTVATEPTEQDAAAQLAAGVTVAPIPDAHGQPSPPNPGPLVGLNLASHSPSSASLAPPPASPSTPAEFPPGSPAMAAGSVAMNAIPVRAGSGAAVPGQAPEQSATARNSVAEAPAGPRTAPTSGTDSRVGVVSPPAIPQPAPNMATAALASTMSTMATATGSAMAVPASQASSAPTAPTDGVRRADAHAPGLGLAARIDWRSAGHGGGRSGDPGSGSQDSGSPATRMLESIQLMRQAGGALSSDAAMPASFAALLASLPTDPAAATAPAAAAPPVPLTNPWPIDDPAFASHLAAQVGESLVGGLERAEISVTPPEMGPIRIELSLAGDQASVAFAAAMPETRNAIEQSLPMLRSMLSEQGLVLADATVGRGDAGAGDAREKTSADGGGERRDQGAGHGRSPGADDRGAGGGIGAAPAGRRTARGLLDLFA